MWIPWRCSRLRITVVCNNPVPVKREDGEAIFKGNLFALSFVIMFWYFQWLYIIVLFYKIFVISAVSVCIESNNHNIAIERINTQINTREKRLPLKIATPSSSDGALERFTGFLIAHNTGCCKPQQSSKWDYLYGIHTRQSSSEKLDFPVLASRSN